MSDPDQHFLVRTEKGWFLTTSAGATPEALSVEQVAELVGEPRSPVGGDVPARPEEPAGRLAPVWCLVGRLGPAGLEVDDRQGGRTVLDARDVRLLEDCAAWAAMATAAAPAGPEVPARLERLVRLRLLGPVDEPPEEATIEVADPDPEPEPVTTPGPPARSGGRIRAVVRALRRRFAGPGVPTGADADAGDAGTSGTDVADGTNGTDGPDGPPADDRIPVYAIWQEEIGPTLSLGMLLASARAHGDGALLDRFDLRPMETTSSFLADLRTRTGPAVLLCSNYLWCLDANLEAARAGLALNPELIVIHGGPSTPAYELEAEEFLTAHANVARVLVRGEGERTLCELLEVLADPAAPDVDERLANVAGITFHGRDGVVVRTGDRERVADLSTLPSPYLSGEFDHLEADDWPLRVAQVETNRGCPYGCTFCDWGSATMSRVRRFEVDRVMAEFRWAHERGLRHVFLCDANFGILPQDEEMADRLVAMRDECGFPVGLSLTMAKNSTSRVLRVLETLLAGGVPVSTCISLQSTDPGTVEAIRRSNISVDVYVELAAALRRRGHGLQGELIVGLPGQTLESFRRDLQFMFDHEIMARAWPGRLLPNSPMNDPAYRSEHGIVSDDLGMVTATATLSPDDFEEAMQLRMTDMVLERYGLMRHVLRLLQWDHGLQALDVEHRLLRCVRSDPGRYPLLGWTLGNFDLFPTAPVGWDSFYDEVLDFVTDELGITPTSDLRCVIDLQKALMPAPGRSFPSDVELEHDYLAYYIGATRTLYTDGRAGRPVRRLAEYPPATFTVTADPLGICERGMLSSEATRDEILESDFHLGQATANELLSPLLRILPGTSWLAPTVLPDRLRLFGVEIDESPAPELPTAADESVPVTIGGRSTT